jgi:hypothetical protein
MPDKMYKVNQQKRQQLNFIYGGLIGIGIFFIISLVNETPLDTPLTLALFCFSIALPFLALLVMRNYIETTHQYTLRPAYINISNLIGVLSIIGGLIAEIWHVTWIAGSIFIACCLWGLLGYSLFQASLKKVNPLPSPEEKDEVNPTQQQVL